MTVNSVRQAIYDVEALRHNEFPISESLAFLNHAGISPLPTRTMRAVQKHTGELGQSPTVNLGHYLKHGVFPLILQFGEDTAALIHAQSSAEIVAASSTSAALNLVAGAIDWRAGDNIVLCDVEFPSNVYPWKAQERLGVICNMVPAQNGTLTVEALDQVVDAKTRLVTVSATQFFTGARSDLQALGDYCHARGILFVVDAIQSIGHIPIDVQQMHIDVLATGSQKSLLGVPGCGFLYVRDEAAQQMQPASISSNSVKNPEHWLDYDMTYADGAQRFGAGIWNFLGMVSIVESLTLLYELGIANIDAHTTAISDYTIDELEKRGYRVVTPRPSELHGPIVTFQYSESVAETDAWVEKLLENNVVVTKHLDREGSPYVRSSVHCYNTIDDIDRLLNLL